MSRRTINSAAVLAVVLLLLGTVAAPAQQGTIVTGILDYTGGSHGVLFARYGTFELFFQESGLQQQAASLDGRYVEVRGYYTPSGPNSGRILVVSIRPGTW
jgi:hypothetical protein